MSQPLPAQVVAVDMEQVVIICPICGKFHLHGSGGDISKTNYGTRVPHCAGDDANRCQGEYELIASEHTTRRKRLLPGDVDAWEDIRRSKRANLEDRWRLQADADRDNRIWAALRAIRANGGRLTRWQIALLADVAPKHVTRWMNRHGIYYGDGRYQVISRQRAGPELCKIFG